MPTSEPPADDLIHDALARADEDPDRLFATLYSELHRLARRELQRNGGAGSLGTTTLLHETFLSLRARSGPTFPDRNRFMAYAARAMRGLVIDAHRRQQAQKRGGEFHITGIGDTEPDGQVVQTTPTRLDDLSTALDALAAIDPALAELVDLHFFCGFSFIEIAEMRGISERTAQREWRKARMLLKDAMEQAGADT
jgi:RNA polymerase sigma factor (TIGR02999 family)